MVRIHDVNTQELIEKTAEELKKVPEIKAPEWAAFVKTGPHKERAPMKDDWWYMRSAAVMRSIYNLGPIGVSKLRTKYGGKQNKGFKPERFKKSSGNIIRKVLQQLEAAGFAKQAEAGVHKGRVLTPAGMSFIDKIASSLSKGANAKSVPAKEDHRPAEKPKPESRPKEVKKEESSNE